MCALHLKLLIQTTGITDGLPGAFMVYLKFLQTIISNVAQQTAAGLDRFSSPVNTHVHIRFMALFGKKEHQLVKC